jgi:hypothetical protein
VRGNKTEKYRNEVREKKIFYEFSRYTVNIDTSSVYFEGKLTEKGKAKSSLVDPDPYLFGPPGSEPFSQRYGSRILLSSSKISKKNIDSYCFVTSL